MFASSMEQITIQCMVSCLKDGDGACWYGRALGIVDGGKGTMQSSTTRLHQASGLLEMCRVTEETVADCFRNWCATVLVDSAADDADCQCDDGATTACCAAKVAAFPVRTRMRRFLDSIPRRTVSESAWLGQRYHRRICAE